MGWEASSIPSVWDAENRRTNPLVRFGLYPPPGIGQARPSLGGAGSDVKVNPFSREWGRRARETCDSPRVFAQQPANRALLVPSRQPDQNIASFLDSEYFPCHSCAFVVAIRAAVRHPTEAAAKRHRLPIFSTLYSAVRPTTIGPGPPVVNRVG